MTIEARFHIRRGEFALDVDLTVPGDGVIALYGPSGSGKTTLLRAIAGLERHRGGYLRVGDATWQDRDLFVPPHRRPIGYVFQEASLFPHLTVQGNLDYGRKRVPESDRSVSIDQAVALLDIGHLLRRKPDELSGGERQRVAIARALAVSPRLLVMDEPLASLDLKRKREILPYIESLRRELDIPVIYVSHLPDELARVADHMVILQAGAVTATGPIGELLTRLDLPLAHEPEAESIVAATVSDHDEEFHLTYLDFSGGRFTVARHDLPLGRKVRLQIAARDVSVTLTPRDDTSVLNIFPATVEQISHEGESQVTIRLMAGNVPLLARVTRKSAAHLGLKPGLSVYAQIKSVAII
ncbi:MAG TPA: molybdenum ABC transporter ATP-binding protein [Rhodothermia bacterium]|nr:molybdenum ABC transporter ATP-binding protein [Rhodothermia bacterium]